MDGTWEQAWTWDDPDWNDINNRDTSAIGFLPGPALTEDAKAKVEEFIAGLGDGSINLFVGPLNFQDGSAFLADGAEADWATQVWYFPQLLEGMTGPSE
jgi:simple sugar transport system substrate-binding protein